MPATRKPITKPRLEVAEEPKPDSLNTAQTMAAVLGPPSPVEDVVLKSAAKALEARGIPPELAKEGAHLINQAAQTLPRWAKIVFAILGAIGTPAVYAFFSTAQTVWSMPPRLEATEGEVKKLSADLVAIKTDLQDIKALLKAKATP